MTSGYSSSTPLNKMYGDSFYDCQIEGSLASARMVLGHLFKLYQPQSVLDVGCGRGTWLKACEEFGTKVLVGFDGSWNSQDKMIDPHIMFRGVDLNSAFASGRRFDLAISLEVAEHLEPESATTFIDALVHASDVILFGAAVHGQGGTSHINEQPQSYWGYLFRERGYVVVDLFRPALWSNQSIEFHYRQNAFLYVNKSHPLLSHLQSHGTVEMKDLGFMDCIHPELYERYRSGERAFTTRAGFFVRCVQLLPHKSYVSLRSLARRFIFR